VEKRRAAHAITTIPYLYAKHADTWRANRTIAALRKVFIEEAIAMGFAGFEDAIAAAGSGATAAVFICSRAVTRAG
jgi:ribosomal protein L12E/L44/L45/RPP1/RPP2